MPRCGDCNKFVSLEPDEPEVTTEDLTINGTADYQIDVTITNNCAECGTALRTAELSASGSFDVDLEDEDYEDADTDEWTIDVDVSNDERVEGKGRAKTFYGFSGTVTLKDGDGTAIETVDICDHIQASHMDEA